jgi:cysteinyl-tRNA synthetase
MSIWVYNTASGKKEEFISREKGVVSAYVCGITPYSFAHIGNARPPLVWDVIRRFLNYMGYKTILVQNITDVDDRIIAKSLQTGRPALEISAEFAEEYFKDLKALRIEMPDIVPKVSEHIPEIIEMVKGLIDKGHAYVVDGDVYYAVESFPGYGKLSGRSLEDMQAGARIEVDVRKRHPMDFALWKSAKPGEPSWDSPWGPGRPGWHIECSAMSLKYLGTSFDFHGGGEDLVFPHHENEIAQSEGYTDQPLARYWLHNAFLVIDREKMSKSLGNIMTVRELLGKYPAKVIRFFIVSAHYRSPLNFGADELAAAAKGLERLETALRTMEDLVKAGPATAKDSNAGTGAPVSFDDLLQNTKSDFIAAMEDDFNTPVALAALYNMVREVNREIVEKDFDRTPGNVESVAKAAALLRELGGILGLFDFEEEVDAELASYVEEQIARRQQAKANRDWALADQIRDELRAKGIILEDTPQGVRWKKA